MKVNNAGTLLRWGVAFVLFYAAIVSLLSPDKSVVQIPELLTMIIPGKPFLVIFAVYEFAVSMWLFWGRKLMWSSLFAALTFAVIVLIDFNNMATVFPFIGLTLGSLALYDLNKKTTKTNGTLQ